MLKKIKNYLLKTKHIALLRIDSNINKNATETFRNELQILLKNKNKIEAVGLLVNSNGGSAVHSEAISSSIRTFCDINKIKLYTFAESYAVSGGYWILTVGDEIYANKASIVGSIGVVSTTINLKSILDKRNIKRSYFTSKNDDKKYIIFYFSDFNKAIDPFYDKSETDFKIIRKLLSNCHENFKDHVLKFREKKLIKDETIRNEIFNANIYLGERSKEIGLVDEIGDYKSVFEKKYKGMEIIKYSNELKYHLREWKFNVLSNLISFENIKSIGDKIFKL